jgi:hypothetical protein
MAWVQGFQGYADLGPQREALVRQLRKMMRGEVNVNNDPYGASPLRMRLYYSGMGIAVLLDRLSPNWKQQVFREGATLTDLAIQALRPSDQELTAALAAVRAQPTYAELERQKAQLQRDGEAATSQLLRQVEAGPKSTLVVDYSELGEVKPAMSFTPFGILRVDDDRTIYRLIPITVKVGGTTIKQLTPAPLLHDRRGKRFVCPLQETVSSERLKELLGGSDAGDRPRKLSRLQIPGVIIDGGFAVIHGHQGRIQIKILPRSAEPKGPEN